MFFLKPLFISHSYLFANSPGGECLRIFIEALKKRSFTPVIYCSDHSPIEYLDADIRLTHDRYYIRYIAAAIRRILPDLTYLPGFEWYSWGIGAKHRILSDIKKGAKYEYIHSVSFPCACHTAALKVKQKTGLPWVAQFYDPWADNPYRRFKTKWLKRMDWKQEKECAENADLIIHDNQVIADVWVQRYGEKIAEKIVVLPLTIPIPPTEVKPNVHKSGEILTISHIGNFMLNRTSQSFIKAVSILLCNSPLYRKMLKVNYIGIVTEAEKTLIEKEHLSDVFNLVGTISPEACVTYYQNTDIFLAIDGVNKNNLFFPSKILKYFYFRRPILGITPDGSVLDIELRKAGHTSIENKDIESIVSYLTQAMCSYEKLLDFDYDYWLHFLPQNVVEEYEEIISKQLSMKCFE